VSQDGVPSETIGGWFRPKQSTAYMFYFCKGACHKRFDISNRGTLDAKQVGLYFPFLANLCAQMCKAKHGKLGQEHCGAGQIAVCMIQWTATKKTDLYCGLQRLVSTIYYVKLYL
jgi:hypothetical protein